MENIIDWYDVIGYEGKYQITKDGRVRSLDRLIKGFYRKGKELKTGKSRSGHVTIRLCDDGFHVNTFIHRILAKLFIPNPSNKPEVNHINGIKTDNRIENLEWCTTQENRIHAIDNGLSRGLLGEVNHFSKLTKEQVIAIRSRGKYDTWKVLAKDYGMSENCIFSIIERRTWKHI